MMGCELAHSNLKRPSRGNPTGQAINHFLFSHSERKGIFQTTRYTKNTKVGNGEMGNGNVANVTVLPIPMLPIQVKVKSERMNLSATQSHWHWKLVLATFTHW